MSPQNLAQRSVHQVRCGVIQTNTGATSLINISLHSVAHFQRTRSKFTDVTNRLAVFLRIFHREGEVSAFQFADRKSTRLNSSHVSISYAVFCLKKKNATRSHHI